MKKLSLALVFLSLFGARPAFGQQTTPFSECGTLQTGPGSVLLNADGGGLFEVAELGSFVAGDRVFVDGELLWGCAAGVVGCVLGNSIRACGPAVGSAYCVGGINSLGLRATIRAHGNRSVAANDLILTAQDMPIHSFYLFFYGRAPLQVPFGAGFRCVGGDVQRLGPQRTANINGVGGRAVDLSAEPALSDIALAVPVSVHFQLWYRDGATSNLTDALTLDFVP